METTKEERIVIVNKILLEISMRGRGFFSDLFGVATIYEKNKRLYMVNEYNGKHMCLSTKYGRQPRSWTHGGTLWGLTKDFKEYIMTGEKCNGENGYGGLYCPHWGYPESDMGEIQKIAKELNYL